MLFQFPLNKKLLKKNLALKNFQSNNTFRNRPLAWFFKKQKTYIMTPPISFI